MRIARLSLQSTSDKETLAIDITDFNSLLAVAGRQEQPQRLLFVFLRTSLPSGSDADQIRRYDDGEGGGLEPIMCVDKTLDELSTFAALVEESKQMGQDWHIVLVASLGGRNGIAPSVDDAEVPLNMMVETVQNGGDLSGFVAFRKNGEPLKFG